MTGRSSVDRNTTKVYLLGGGIDSMATAVFIICDGDTVGETLDPSVLLKPFRLCMATSVIRLVS
jgi:myosin-crossreactive antigen